jgi:uncharacterized coiled-coil protein SlyX
MDKFDHTAGMNYNASNVGTICSTLSNDKNSKLIGFQGFDNEVQGNNWGVLYGEKIQFYRNQIADLHFTVGTLETKIAAQETTIEGMKTDKVAQDNLIADVFKMNKQLFANIVEQNVKIASLEKVIADQNVKIEALSNPK